MKEQYNEDVRLDVEVILRAIRTKENLIQTKDNDVLEEDSFDEDIQEATDFVLKLTINIEILSKSISGKSDMKTPNRRKPLRGIQRVLNYQKFVLKNSVEILQYGNNSTRHSKPRCIGMKE